MNGRFCRVEVLVLRPSFLFDAEDGAVRCMVGFRGLFLTVKRRLTAEEDITNSGGE
jgi:hypothetical protein